jgi:hypothetical protein
MPQIDIREIGDEVVLYYGSEDQRINAYTLASTLVAFADAAKAVNLTINPGHEIEIVVEALGPGSFKAKLRAIYTQAANLFSKDPLKGIILGIISTIIYEHCLAPKKEVKIDVSEDAVVIEQGDTRVTVSRHVYEAVQAVKKDATVRESVGTFFRSLEEDPKISLVGVTKDMAAPAPVVSVPREAFGPAAADTPVNANANRTVTERSELQILRAVLDRGKRKWEFSWRGFKISAPIVDDAFYAKFFAHRITIAPGDTLDVDLTIRQRRDPDIGVYTNDEFLVTKVHHHTPRVLQTGFD